MGGDRPRGVRRDSGRAERAIRPPVLLGKVRGFVGPAAVRAELARRALQKTFASGARVTLELPVQPSQVDLIEVAPGLAQIAAMTSAGLGKVNDRLSERADRVVIFEP